ncbi:uncharacterized protein LOC131552871 [Onychostoma macrolepis]|uniref:uncharacterized protein LOC131552871 n=1 Tax=Onychostoma macrolepis TaxID=369639 RepID=UPI00272AFE27|nr:uncharacterized protein LOC131552871 [Onychostoma macrolepis]
MFNKSFNKSGNIKTNLHAERPLSISPAMSSATRLWWRTAPIFFLTDSVIIPSCLKIYKFEHPAQKVLLKHYRLRHYQERNRQLPTANYPASTPIASAPLKPLEHCSLTFQDHTSAYLHDTDPEETGTKGLKVGVLTIVKDDVATVNSNPTIRTMAVVVEEQTVLDEVEDLPNAFALFFGLIYALNIEYPKQVIQKLFMQLGSQCSPKVLNLKNKFLSFDV